MTALAQVSGFLINAYIPQWRQGQTLGGVQRATPRMCPPFGPVLRDPLPRHHWIADQVRNDKDGRNDKNMQDLVAGALSAAA